MAIRILGIEILVLEILALESLELEILTLEILTMEILALDILALRFWHRCFGTVYKFSLATITLAADKPNVLINAFISI